MRPECITPARSTRRAPSYVKHPSLLVRMRLTPWMALLLVALPVRAHAQRTAPGWGERPWLNTDHPLVLEALRGHVVLLNFWVYSCYNCTNTLPALIALDRRFHGAGLVTIGMHTPEFPPYSGEHDAANVGRALRQYGVTWPVAQDNDRRTWDRFGIRYWPTVLLIDRRGRIRHEVVGEFHDGDRTYVEVSERIAALLAE